MLLDEDARVEDNNDDDDAASVMWLRFLWETYSGRFWYWEIVETLRRLFMTGLLSGMRPGSAEQIVLGIFFVFLYTRMLSRYRPYVGDAENRIAESAQWTLVSTLLVSVVIKFRALNGDDSGGDSADALLVGLNVAGAVTIMWAGWNETRVERYEGKSGKSLVTPADAILNSITCEANPASKDGEGDNLDGEL